MSTLATARLLVGRTIVRVELRPFETEKGIAHDPRITLDNGAVLYFSVEETGGPEYGVFPGYSPKARGGA